MPSSTSISTASSPQYPTFHTLYAHLLTLPPPLLPPTHAPNPTLTTAIAALSLHPTLEAACHILNSDLPSAHFLVRHMQAPPAHEGMFLHGILHRVEGDYENARAWYGDVCESDVFRDVWAGGLEEAGKLIDGVEGLRKRGEGDREGLGRESLREIRGVVEWCIGKFGEGEVGDARGAWVQPSGKEKEMGAKMIIGGEGWRKF